MNWKGLEELTAWLNRNVQTWARRDRGKLWRNNNGNWCSGRDSNLIARIQI